MEMAKRAQRNGRMNETPGPEQRKSPLLPGTSWGTTIVVLAVLAVVGYINGRQTRQLRQTVDYRLDQLDNRLLDLSKKVDAAANRVAAPAAQRGPDPNRAYPIKTAGAPVKGPMAAPITIAEFSDFQ
jgi:hypothetical protein